MANHYAAKRITLTAASAFLFLLGCSGDDASTTSDLSSAALDIEDTVDSRAAAQTQANDCFAEFKSCKEAVGGDAKACADTLKACLPEDAPFSRRCERGDGGSDRDDDIDEDADEATEEAASPDGGNRRGRDKRKGHGSDDGADAGVDDHDDDGDHQGRGRGRGRGCERPSIASSRFRECTASTANNVQQGMDTTAAADDHKRCIQKAFSERIESLCDHATKLCERADAEAAICGQIATACASLDK